MQLVRPSGGTLPHKESSSLQNTSAWVSGTAALATAWRGKWPSIPPCLPCPQTPHQYASGFPSSLSLPLCQDHDPSQPLVDRMNMGLVLPPLKSSLSPSQGSFIN